MKITRRQIRGLILEWFSDEHDPETGERDQYEDLPNQSYDRGFGWADFQAMAQTGDYEGAGQWLQDLARDRGLTIDREVEDMMIEIATDEYITGENLESEWEEIMDQRSGASARARPWEHN